MYWIARRLTGDAGIAGATACAFIFLPVVMSGAHEAKPHLPGAVLMLMAVMAAVKYLETGKHLWWILTVAACGAAAGMVLSSLPIFLVIVVMAALRRGEKIGERIGTAAAALAIGVVVYFITNPYVAINLLNADSDGGRALRSNFANSKAMYSVSLGGIVNGVKLMGLGTSPLLAMLGVAAGVVLIALARKQTEVSVTSKGIAWLLLVPAGAFAIQFLLLAAGKPAEYARFAILPAAALLLVGAWGAAVISANNSVFRQLLPALLVVATLPYGLSYLRAFVRDARAATSRTMASDELPPTGRILLYHEPAPYNMPPVNLFRRDLVLVPKDAKPQAGSGDLLIYPVDVPVPNTLDGPRRLPFKEAPGSLDQFTTPITWANKTFAVEGLGAAAVE